MSSSRGPLRALSIAVACTFTTSLASATDAPRARDIHLELLGNAGFDVGYIAVGGSAFFLSSLIISPRDGDIAPLDGLGRRERSPAFERASDVTLAFGIFGGPLGAFATELAKGTTGIDRAREPLILSEGALMASAFTHVIKDLAGVCRPRDWREETRTCGAAGEEYESPSFRLDESHRSFPSGHVTPLAGMMGAAYGMWLLPSRRRDELAPLALSMTALAGTMAILREQAGAHSFVDTGTAFFLGGTIGFLTALLHTKTTNVATVSSQPGTSQPQVSFSGAF